MSLGGYKPKTKPALWKSAFPSQAVKSAHDQAKAVGTRGARRWRVRSESKKRRAESAVYRKLKLDFLTANPRCQRCGTWSSCVHHWAGRRSNFLKVRTWRASCVPCNDWAKNNPRQARIEGWLAPVGVYLT